MDRIRGWLPALLLLGVFVVENPQCGDGAASHQQLAVFYLEHGQHARALAEARRAIRQDPTDPSPHLIAALAYLGQGQLPAAVGVLAQAIRLNPRAAQPYATLREICQRERRFDLARQTFADLLVEQPDNPQVKAGLGWSLVQLGEDALAAENLAQACGQPEGGVFPCLQLGRLYLRQERSTEASQALEQALGRAPGDPELLVALGECALRMRNQTLAETRFGQAVTASRTPQSTSVDIAQVYYDLGQRPQAIAYYERAMQQGTPDPLLQNNLAWTYAEEGVHLDRALELSLQAVKSEADNVVYLDTYAEVLYLCGHHAHALAVIRRACALEPEGGANYQYLQGQLEKLSRAAAAIAQRR